MIRRTVAALAVISLVVATVPAAAQRPQARVSVGGGSATDIRGVRSAAYSLSPSVLVFPGASSVLVLGGRGTSFTTGEWAVGGNLLLLSRQPVVGPLGLSLSGSGEFTQTSYEVRYGILDGTTAAELALGPVTVFGGVRSAVARTWADAPAPSPLSGRQTVATTSSSFGPVYGGRLRVPTPGLGPGLELGYREDRAEVESVRVIDRQGTARVSAGPLTVQGSYGRRVAPDEETGFGGVSLAARLTPVIAAVGAVERYPSNRLTGTFAGRTVSVGLVFQIGGRAGPRALPRPSGVDDPRPGFTRVSIKAPSALRVELAGDWSGWKPEPAQRAANGVWYRDLALRPGEYRYAFRVNGTTWTVPAGAVAVDDGFGGKSAWLTVRAPARTDTSDGNFSKEAR
jgi:hypothetical protein